MRNNLFTLSTLSLAIAGLGINTAANAADDAATLELIFEEIVVTGKKREQSIYEAPVAISAFTGDTIEKQGITDLVDVGKFVPNLNITTFSAGNTSSANPFIRGIGLQDHLITTDPGVGVYVDGVYLGRQVGQNWDLNNIERLEVLRGPQGTLFGRNSIGGAINIITRKPGEEPSAKVTVQAGTRGRINTSFFADAKLSETVAATVSAGFKHRDGIGKFLLIESPEAEVGEMQEASARVSLLWTPSETFSLLFAADGNNGDNGQNPFTTLIDEVPNGAVYGLGYRNSDLAADRYDSNSGQEDLVTTSNEAWGMSVTAEMTLTENVDAKIIASRRRSEYEGGLDDDSFYDDLLSFPEVGYADQTSIELQVNGEYDEWDFVSGLYYFEEDGENSQVPSIFLGGAGTFLLGQDTESVAAYLNVGRQINENLRVSGGVRYTEDEKDAYVNLSDVVMPSASRTWDEVSWEMSASYQLDDKLSVYATVASGYQSGNFPPRPYCLFGSVDFSQAGNVSPDHCFTANDNITALNYEAGIKGQPLENLEMSISVFNTEYEDLPYQVSTTAVGGFDTRSIIVDQTSRGVEWESSLYLSEGLFIHTSLGYIDVDVDDTGAVAPLTPEITASISPEYTQSFASGASLTYRLDWSFRDEMFGEPTEDAGRFTKIDSRDLINFDISYISPDDSWSAALYGRNITDERYVNARLNTGDYVLSILSNDASEFGVRFSLNY